VNGGAGAWIARFRTEGTGTPWREKALGSADDFQDADGRISISFRQAQDLAQAWFDQAREEATGEKMHRGPLTVAQAMEAYLDAMDRDGKKSAKDARARSGLHILPALGPVEVEKLTRLRLEKWLSTLAASARTKKKSKLPPPKRPRKPVKAQKPTPPPKTADEKRARKATANRVLATLKAGLTYAKVRGLARCPDDAWRNVKPFRAVDEARQNYMTPDEQQRLLNAIKDADFKRLVYGALLTGCRYGELTRMKVRDFDATSGTVLILESKAGRPRRALLTVEGSTYFASITAGRDGTETLFTHEAFQDMRRIDPVTQEPVEKIQRAWGPSEQTRRMHDACEAAKLPRMGFHQLRHSYASALVAAGMPLAYVAQLTGHADTRILEKHYAHLAPSDLSRSLEALAPKLGIPVAPVAALKIKKEGA
jgi:integrase